jgi:hypothetical protein
MVLHALIAEMWADNFQNFDIRNANTTTAVEGYLGSIKMIVGDSKRWLPSRRLDWLLYMLMTVILGKYKLQASQKLHGLLRNKKEEAIVEKALVCAPSIPDENVQFPQEGGGPYHKKRAQLHRPQKTYQVGHLVGSCCTLGLTLARKRSKVLS